LVNIYKLSRLNNPEDFGFPILNAFRVDQVLYCLAWRRLKVLLRCSVFLGA